MKTNIYLDSRGKSPLQESPVKISISHHSETTYVPTNVCVAAIHWDTNSHRVVSSLPSSQRLNTIIEARKVEVDTIIGDLQKSFRLRSMRATDVRKEVLRVLDPELEVKEHGTFIKTFREFMGLKSRDNTIRIYNGTLDRIRDFDPRYEDLNYEDITFSWLKRFDAWLAVRSPSANARNIHFRNIRAVFNYAIDDERTTLYPFRRFKMKYTETKKRNLTIDQLRKLWSYEADTEARRLHVATFKLMFCLIGANPVDLFAVNKPIVGRYEYVRSKTSKLYDIEVTPEAQELITLLSGDRRPFCFQETYKRQKSWGTAFTRALHEIADELGLPKISAYWARHTWASIAASLDIPKETIARALGHHDSSVTSVYINFDNKKVDEANRKVLAYVLGRI